MGPVVVRLTKQVLVFETEAEFLRALFRDSYEKARKAGKYYNRAKAQERREADGRYRQRQESRLR